MVQLPLGASRNYLFLPALLVRPPSGLGRAKPGLALCLPEHTSGQYHYPPLLVPCEPAGHSSLVVLSLKSTQIPLRPLHFPSTACLLRLLNPPLAVSC